MDTRPFEQYREQALAAYEKGGASSLSFMSSFTYVPIYALVLFCLEKYPEDVILLKQKRSLEEFYGY